MQTFPSDIGSLIDGVSTVQLTLDGRYLTDLNGDVNGGGLIVIDLQSNTY